MLRKFLDKQGEMFEKGGKLEKLYPLYELIDTFLYTPGETTKRASFVRDGADLKRFMITVAVALLPAILFGIYNTGYWANYAIESGMGTAPENWQATLYTMMGLAFDSANPVANVVHGLMYYLPILIVVMGVGGIWEVIFATVRKHEVNEGFLVTAMLIPLIVSPAIPLWQLAIATSFGIVLGKEVFGGVGYNILNPALTARAFLFFAYPQDISGNAVWVAVDGFSSATPLALAAEQGLQGLCANSDLLYNAVMGWIPGSIGETSAVAIAIGAFILLATGVASWRIMAGVAIGTVVISQVFNLASAGTDSMMSVPFYWHMAVGGWAFGTVFMATDPVSGPASETGRWIYGILIGMLVVLVRVVNPAYPEGMMLSILLMNVFAPLIDHYVKQAHIKRREARYAR